MNSTPPPFRARLAHGHAAEGLDGQLELAPLAPLVCLRQVRRHVHGVALRHVGHLDAHALNARAVVGLGGGAGGARDGGGREGEHTRARRHRVGGHVEAQRAGRQAAGVPLLQRKSRPPARRLRSWTAWSDRSARRPRSKRQREYQQAARARGGAAGGGGGVGAVQVGVSTSTAGSMHAGGCGTRFIERLEMLDLSLNQKDWSEDSIGPS